MDQEKNNIRFEDKLVEDIINEYESLGKMLAKSYDRMIAREIADIIEKYLPDRKIDEEKVLELARMLLIGDVTPVKHGYNVLEGYPDQFRCSVCEWGCWDTYAGDTNEYNYCPNCGAKMDGGK